MLSPQQFADWGAYYDQEPWGFHAEEFRWGLLTATVAQVGGSQTAPEEYTLSTAIERLEEDGADPLDQFDRATARSK